VKLSLRKKLLDWCPQPKNPVSPKINNQIQTPKLLAGNFRRTPSFFVGASALLLALGTYLQTIEIPVRITSEPYAADQYDLMHAFWPLSFALWILAFAFLGYGFILKRRLFANNNSERTMLPKSLIAPVALGVLTAVSPFLPWVIAKTTVSGQIVSLSGISLLRSSYWAGDVMYLVFISALIAIFYVSVITFVEKRRMGIAKGFLLILSGACIIGAILSVVSTNSWFYISSFMGGVGGQSTTFESSGIGLLIASFTAAGFVVLGANTMVKLARQRSLSATCRLENSKVA
jgi:hypothetical protein